MKVKEVFGLTLTVLLLVVSSTSAQFWYGGMARFH